MSARTPAGDVLSELVLAVFRLNGDFLSAAEHIAGPAGLTAARWQVIGAILEAPASVAAVARRMGLARQSVQRLTDILAREGLVEYLDNPSHKRAKLVTLTDHGRAVVKKLVPRQHRWADEISRGIPLERLADALKLLTELSARTTPPMTQNSS